MLIKAEGYRKDIDGLRALAVLLVVLYHIANNIVHAGFIGVDVFFVISGFLITTYIYKNIENGCFSLKEFYLRRMRRILPVLMVVLFCTTVAAYFFLVPLDLKNYSHSLIATILSVSNFYFRNFIHLGYFSTDATVIPLLHTWSLGVEEQFYLIWPLLLIFLFRIFANKKYILVAIIFLTLCSFLTYYFLRDEKLVYYSPMTRGFELCLGAILAFKYQQFNFIKNKFLLHLFSIMGLGMILYAGCTLTVGNYPGLAVLLPTFGTVALIYTGRENVGIANKILSLPPLVFIGLISYSLYLWHWPIIAFINYFSILLSLKIQIVILIFSIGLSFLTWKFVEQPFRRKIKLNFKKTLALTWGVSALAAFIFFLQTAWISNFGFNRISDQAQKVISNQYFGSLNPNGVCHNLGGPSSRLGTESDCAIGDTALQNAQVLLVGDSHAMAANGMIDVFLKKVNLKGYIATQAGTPFLLPDSRNKDLLIDPVLSRDSIIERLIEQQHFKYVILGGYWSNLNYIFRSPSVNKHDDFKLTLINAVKFILKNQSIPVILLDFPSLGHISVSCGFNRIPDGNCYNAVDQIRNEQLQSRHAILEIKKSFPQLILIDPSKIICDNNKCYSSINGIPLYFDGQKNSHLNYAGSSLIGALYQKKFGNPFKRDG